MAKKGTPVKAPEIRATGSRCHVCRGNTVGDFLYIQQEEREYELCDGCMQKLAYHMLDMLHDHLSQKHEVPKADVQKMIKKGML